MPSRIHSFLPRLAIVVTPLLLAGAGYLAYRGLFSTYDVPTGGDVFQAVQGRWAWNPSAANCDTNAFTMRFTPDHSDLLLTSPRRRTGLAAKRDSVTRYAVLGHTRHSVEVVRPGERLLTADSTPVVWDLMLRTPDAVSWRRGDWPVVPFAPVLHRCGSR